MPNNVQRARASARQHADETYADPERRAAREAEATAWTPVSDSDYRADATTRRTASGDLFDPTQDPATRYGAIADNGNNLYDYTVRGRSLLNRGAQDVERRADAATASRGAADAWRDGARPTWEAPTYDPGAGFTFDQDAPGLESDADVGARFQYFQGLLDPDGALSREGLDYTPERVGDYGAAFQTYLQGAQGAFGNVLAEQLRRLNEGAAAKGRLRSGFYDEDVGLLSRQLAGDFSNQAKMAAIEAAGLSLQGAEGNADRALEAARLKRGWAESALGQNRSLLGDALGRTEYLDTARRGAYESDRAFARDSFDTDREFGRATFEDDRNFGYGAHRDTMRDWENDRDVLEDRYRFDEGLAADARGFYADWLTGMTDRRTDMTRYQDAQPSWIERAAGVVTPLAGMALDAFAPGAGTAATAAMGAMGAAGGGARPTFDYGGFDPGTEDLMGGWEPYYQRRWGGGAG